VVAEESGSEVTAKENVTDICEAPSFPILQMNLAKSAKRREISPISARKAFLSSSRLVAQMLRFFSGA
jgi:hypothetical protein